MKTLRLIFSILVLLQIATNIEAQQQKEMVVYGNNNELFRINVENIDSIKFIKAELPEEPCNCIMDTLKGDWIWFKKHGGIIDNTWVNEFKSVIRILSQNEDGSINYQIFVADTLFSSGSFELTSMSWSGWKITTNIKFPHWFWVEDEILYFYESWAFYFDYPFYYNNVGNLTKDKNTLIFWDTCYDGYFYYYEKIGVECSFENPLEDLPWLKNFTEQLLPGGNIKVYQCIYQDVKVGFIVKFINTDTYLLFNCSGHELWSGNINNCEDYNINNIELIWE